MAITRPKHICQYWQDKEPVQCKYWNNSETYCTFEEEVKKDDGSTSIVKAPLYPLCNSIGTSKFRCSKYSGSGTEARCVIPDPYRATPQYENCSWTTVTGTVDTSDGGPINTPVINYDRINEYNDGKCNSSAAEETAGANPKCRGYSPHIMGFSRRAPICDDIEDATASPATPRKTEVTGIRGETYPFSLPATYTVLNLRAKMGKCFWWNGENIEFAVDGTGIVVAPTWNCLQSDTSTVDKYKDYFLDNTLAAYLPPCNGAKPECPYYSGTMIAPSNGQTYLSDSYLRKGDKMLAEQILELRYNIRRKKWTKDKFYEAFKEAEIYAFSGDRPTVKYKNDGSIEDYNISSIRTYIKKDTFESNCFEIVKSKASLTKGNASTSDTKKHFPTLITELKQFSYSPIIETKFEHNAFETSMSDHKFIRIFGTCAGPNSNIVAINISDPELNFNLWDIKKYDNIYDIKTGEGDARYQKTLSSLNCYMDFLTEYGQGKVFNNNFASDNRAFSIDIETFFGENIIVVFDGANNWAYDKVTVKKIFCNGILAQTGFSVEATGTTNVPENQEINLVGKNPEIKFEYKPFVVKDFGASSRIDHIYMDTKISVLASNPLIPSSTSTINIGYRYYKVTAVENSALGSCYITSLGTDGTFLITIPDPDKKLHCIIKPWELKEKITLTGKDSAGVDRSIEMSLDQYCTDNLEINQAIISPKDSSTYRRLYDLKINISAIYVYERRSFGQKPQGTYETVQLSTPTITYNVFNPTINGVVNEELTLTNIPTAPIVMSAVFRGNVSGRIKGQMKSDMIVWSKSAFCSDVEILYSWSANYSNVELNPTHYKYKDLIGITSLGTTQQAYKPHCGDHSFGNSEEDQTRKPMWYPYGSCNYPAKYEIFAGSGEYDEDRMEIFEDKYPTEQIRMLGPATSIGITSDVNTSISNCTYDYTHNNLTQFGEPWFSGYGKMRTGINDEDMLFITRNGGFPPKFGNKIRDSYYSFRSSAALYHYNINSEGEIWQGLKWLPKAESFSLTTVDRSFIEYPFDHYFNTGDLICNYLDQFGNFVVEGSIDDTVIDEYVLDGEYKFNEVFRPHSTNYGIVYPKATRSYELGTLNPKPVLPWYTYKNPPTGNGAIQWAWRTKWRDINRPNADITQSMLRFNYKDCAANEVEHLKNTLKFIQLFYPNYTYDSKAEEKQRVCDENSYNITWQTCTRPVSTLPGAAIIEWYFILKMDSGPVVLFDKSLNVVTDKSIIENTWGSIPYFDGYSNADIARHVEFNRICSGTQWLDGITASTDLESVEEVPSVLDVMLYTEDTVVTDVEDDATTNAQNEDRVVDYYDSGTKKDFYYNQGIVARINSGNITYIPRNYSKNNSALEFSLSRKSNDTTNFSTIEINTFYSVLYSFGATYDASNGSSVDLIYRFDGTIVGKVDFVFGVGSKTIPAVPEVHADPPTPAIPAIPETKHLYHVPEVTVYGSTDGVVYNSLGQLSFEFFSSGGQGITSTTRELELTLSMIDMNTYITHLKLSFRYSPTVNEVAVGDENYSNFMKLVGTKLYGVVYKSATESISTYERRYKVSSGGYADFPVHGYDTTGSLLYATPDSLSTVYHVDMVNGIIGMTGTETAYNSVSKLRGRKCGDVKEDKILLGGTVASLEEKQKQLYDSMVDLGTTTIKFKSILDKVMSDDMVDAKVTVIPKWECTLTNGALLKLTSVKSQKYFYPAGHYWNWDICNMYDMSPCGQTKTTERVFDYIWQRVGDECGLGWPSISPFILYGSIPAAILKRDLAGR